MSRTFVPGGPPRYRHQRAGLRKLIETRGVGALLFDPGTGKTATVIDYASLLALKLPGGEARVLVVAPVAALDTWVSQAEEYASPQVDVWAEAVTGSIRQRAAVLAVRGCAPFSGRDAQQGSLSRGEAPRATGWGRSAAVVARSGDGRTHDPKGGPDQLARPRVVLEAVTLDSFASREAIAPGAGKTRSDLMIDAVKRFQPDLLVVDESHRIKSATSNTSRALSRLTNVVPRRVLLTGTVMPHSPLDVFGQWRFLDPSVFGYRNRQGRWQNATLGSFKARYARMGGWMGKEIISFHRLDEMQARMARNAVVARKEDALDLPETTDVIVPVDLSAKEAKAYKAMKDDLAARLDDGSLAAAPNRLSQMMRLRQLTSGFLPDDLGEVQEIGESKARVIRSIVHDNLAGESRIVVFAHFRPEIRLLESVLAELGTEILTITGDTATEDRQLIRKRFGSADPARMVLIAQTRTMSLAVNELVTASHAVYGSLSERRDDMIQSRDRLNRIGQTKPVTFWYALAPHTVDEVMMHSHRDRTNLESAVLAHIRDTE